MVTRVLLARHGDTQASQDGRFTGGTDIPLSHEGMIHATELGVRLARYPIDAFYASSMHRALETCQHIAAIHGMEVTPMPAFCEIDHGAWNGKNRAELVSTVPDQVALYDADPFHFKPEGGESGEDVLNRAAPALQALVKEHDGQTIMVVAHKTTNRLLISQFCGMDPSQFRLRLAQRPACLNVLQFYEENQAQLLLLNDIGHYGMSDSARYQYVV